MMLFPKKIDIKVPEGESGDWKVKYFKLEERDVMLDNLRALRDRAPWLVCEPGNYVKLTCKGSIVMSNTPMEIRTHREFFRHAKGHILINGLGLGMAVAYALTVPEVKSITVVEKSEDVIKLSGPTYSKDVRVEIINADAFEYKAPKGMTFDCVWHDIWNDISSDNLPQMTKLKRKYAHKSEWQGCWSENEVRTRRKWR